MAEGNSNNNPQAKETRSRTSTAKSQAEPKVQTTIISTNAPVVEPQVQTTVISTKTQEDDSKLLALSTFSTPTTTLLPNNRPVEPSHLKVVHTYSSVGSARPVTQGNVKFSSSIVISGNRPIAASTLKISDSYLVMGNRPVASNEIDDAASLMGYLD